MSNIISMTAFARNQDRGNWGAAVWEIRSVNHRYLELSVRLPESWRELESAVRERVRQHLHRGKVDCTLQFQPGAAVKMVTDVNKNMASQLITASQELSSQINDPAPVSPIQILRFPGVVSIREQHSEEMAQPILDLLDATLQKAVTIRSQEGSALANLIEQRLQTIDSEINTLKPHLPEIISSQREKITERLAEISGELEPTRLEQEMVLFSQKVDVAEEMDRIETHITEVRRVLDTGGVCGRRLDFLMQELNREANTLASKSASKQTTRSAVEIKVMVEQMREQVQNIE